MKMNVAQMIAALQCFPSEWEVIFDGLNETGCEFELVKRPYSDTVTEDAHSLNQHEKQVVVFELVDKE